MSVEMYRREGPGMREQAEERAEYLGAMLSKESRLVLVPMDPKEPWEAFRRLRSWMKQSETLDDLPAVDVFEAPAALTNTNAKIIPLTPRQRRTG
jgi:hypothetical protein